MKRNTLWSIRHLGIFKTRKIFYIIGEVGVWAIKGLTEQVNFRASHSKQEGKQHRICYYKGQIDLNLWISLHILDLQLIFDCSTDLAEESDLLNVFQKKKKISGISCWLEAVWLSASVFSVIIGQAPLLGRKILVQILLARWEQKP